MSKIGFVYLISNEDQSVMYIGSTTRTLYRRWKEHQKYATYDVDVLTISIHQYLHDTWVRTNSLDGWSITELATIEYVHIEHLQVYEQLWINKYRLKYGDRIINIDNPAYQLNTYIFRRTHVNYKPHKNYRAKCDCGKHIKNSNLARHKKSDVHYRRMILLNA